MKFSSYMAKWGYIGEELDDYFEVRTNNHIGYVKKAAEAIVEQFPEFSELLQRAEHHDASKFEYPEKIPYVYITEKYRCEQEGEEFDCPEGMANQMNEATLHHITINRHHPEFHLEDKSQVNLSAECRDESDFCVDASRMPDLDIVEMVCDWAGMAMELGGTPREWYDQNKNTRWYFSEEQDQLINQLLCVFDK